jgi:DNA-binding NarL/FixJ family response regulator
MTNADKYRIAELERKVAGMQDVISELKTTTALTKADLSDYKKANNMKVRDLEIRDAVARGVSRSSIAREMKLTEARISQIVNKKAVS